MRASEFSEASYKGNLGMMEMIQFFKLATEDEKNEMKQFLEQGDEESAWELLQLVTDVDLVETMSRRGFLGALGAGAMAASGVAKAAGARPSQTYNVLSNNIPNELAVHKAAVKYGLRGVELAQFLGQVKHESWNFDHLKEKGKGAGYFEQRYGVGTPTGRRLGNTHPGDGERYKGRGFIQLTGKYNYQQAGDSLGLDLLNHPELASRPDIAAIIAVWYWKTRVKPNVSNFKDTTLVTKQINPSLNGLEDRQSNFKQYLQII